MNSARNFVCGKMRDPVRNGIVAHYPFDSNYNDIAGYNHNATNSGTTLVSGKIGNAAQFSTYPRYIDIPDNADFSFTLGSGVDTSFSISMWVNFSSLSGQTGRWLINKSTATAGGGEWQLTLTGSNLIFVKLDRSNNANYQGIQSNSTTFVTNTWYHIVVTDSGSKTNAGMKIYINNTLISVTNFNNGSYTGMPKGTSITRLGNASWSHASGFQFNGMIDAVRIYKGKELNTTEIATLWNGGAGI